MYPRELIDPPGEVELPTSPLRLYEKRVWDPAEQYWGEPGGMLEMCLVEVIAAGPRLEFESSSCCLAGKIPTRQTRSSTRLSCVTAATPIALARYWRA